MAVDVKNFDNRVKLAVESYAKSSKPLVGLLVESVEIFNADSNNAAKVAYFVNQLAKFPRLQAAAKAIAQELAPVQFVEDNNGVFKASVAESYKNLVKDSKDARDQAKQAKKVFELETLNNLYASRLKTYKERDYNSLLATRSYDEAKETNYFKPVKIDKLETKIKDLATNLIAVAMLSNPALTREEAIQKLTAKISGIVDSEIQTVKDAITDKTPLKPVKTTGDVANALNSPEGKAAIKEATK
ncbi:hypothetical protein G7D34_003691 [Salmonella enterica]|nr:hypothetical protein [Salmonella enterica]